MRGTPNPLELLFITPKDEKRWLGVGRGRGWRGSVETGSDVNNYPVLLKVQNRTTTYVVVITHRFLLNALKWVREEAFLSKRTTRQIEFGISCVHGSMFYTLEQFLFSSVPPELINLNTKILMTSQVLIELKSFQAFGIEPSSPCQPPASRCGYCPTLS